MGFNPSTDKISLVAYLTPYGRSAMVSNNNNLIATFRLGDSRANYYAANVLTSGQVPGAAGRLGPNGSISNSTTQLAGLRSFLILNSKGQMNKPVELQSSIISSEIISNGQVTVNGNYVSQNYVDRANYQSDSLVNLFYTFGLPLNAKEDSIVSATTYANGGFSDTAISGFATTKVIILGLNNSKYGETIDGKELNINLATLAGNFQIFSTFQNTGASAKVLDVNTRETSVVTEKIGSNIAFLFCDAIQKPNNDSTLSWSTGFGSYKPFSQGKKLTYNFVGNKSIGTVADKAVGVAFLDMGFAVITEPSMVSAFTSTTATSMTFNSVSTAVYQNITCLINRGEFISSTNRTFGAGDIPRITEVGFYDREGRLVAMGTTDRQVPKNANEFLALSAKISL